jgi:hypothetical protein
MRNLLQYAPNTIRVVALGLVVGNAVIAVTLKATADTSREGLRSLGRSMLRYADGRTMNSVRSLSLNGLETRFATGSTTDSVRQVMDFYAARCREVDGQMSAQVRERLPAGSSGRPLPADFDDTVSVNEAVTMIRFVTDTEGMLVCFDAGRGRVDYVEFINRVRQAVERGDVTGAADFRYVYASRLGAGDRTTHVAGFWTEGSAINPGRMFPESGDAPGRAVPSLPRPAGLRRTLSAYERGTPYSYSMFAGATPSGQVEQQLRRDLVAQGWTFVPINPRGARQVGAVRPGEHLLSFERGPANVMFHVTAEGGRTSVVQFSEEASAIR